MKHAATTVAGLVIVVLALLWYFFVSGPDAPLPAYPSTVSETGRYMIDSARFVEIRRVDGKLEYYEGSLDPPAAGSGSPSIVGYEFELVPGVRLMGSWTLSLAPPDTIVINPGHGSVIRRRFGRSSAPVATPTPTPLHTVISGSPVAVPANEVEAVSP